LAGCHYSYTVHLNYQGGVVKTSDRTAKSIEGRAIPKAEAASIPIGTPPFTDYLLDRAYDEMFDANGYPRAHYQQLYQRMLELTP